MSDSVSQLTEPPADEIFHAVADPVRISILKALWNADDHSATFAELQRAAGVEDSGRFNYHLSKLRGTLITNREDTYHLLLSGRQTIGVLLSGSLTRNEAIGAVQTTYECPACDNGDLTFQYADEEVQIECRHCMTMHIRFPVPSGVFDGYRSDKLPDIADRYIRTILCELRNEFCPTCNGRVHTDVQAAEDALSESDSPPDDHPFVTYECERCSEVMTVDARTAVATFSEVIAFYSRNGEDLRNRPLWDFYTFDSPYSKVIEQSPFRAKVTFETDDQRLSIVIDDELEVVDIVENS